MKLFEIIIYLKFLFHVFFFVCFFVLLESSDRDAGTPNAFIFSLKFERLAPFVSKVKKDKTAQAIYRGSDTGPVFSQDLAIDLTHEVVETVLDKDYSVPNVVKGKLAILGWHNGKFSPDEVEVFYLDPSRQMQDNTNWVQLKVRGCI